MNLDFQSINPKEFSIFREEIKQIFSIATLATNGKKSSLSDDDVNKTLLNPKGQAFFVYENGERVGGVAVEINADTQHNKLDLFYILPSAQGKNLGLRIWQAVEKMYPDTKIWETFTPYFEKRNIHFYVNKCGFSIVEFLNPYHPTEDAEPPRENELENEFFRFEKRMNTL